jgi:hypothetical protein
MVEVRMGEDTVCRGRISPGAESTSFLLPSGAEFADCGGHAIAFSKLQGFRQN